MGSAGCRLVAVTAGCTQEAPRGCWLQQRPLCREGSGARGAAAFRLVMETVVPELCLSLRDVDFVIGPS